MFTKEELSLILGSLKQSAASIRTLWSIKGNSPECPKKLKELELLISKVEGLWQEEDITR